MKDEGNVIVERSMAYALRAIGLFRGLEKDSVGRVLGTQVLRAGTSIGANVHEAQAAQTRPDFISKMSIAHKEAREAAYWLRLIGQAQLCSASTLGDLGEETEQIIKILSSILITAKRKAQQ